jgi:hypothetical protein
MTVGDIAPDCNQLWIGWMYVSNNMTAWRNVQLEVCGSRSAIVLLQRSTKRNIRVDNVVRTMSSRTDSSRRPDLRVGGLVGGAQLIAGIWCVRVRARDAEVEFAQIVDHCFDEFGTPIAK